MFASEELHFDNKNRFTTFREFVHPPKVVPHHAPYWEVEDCSLPPPNMAATKTGE